MPDSDLNAVDPAGQATRAAVGDVPDRIRRRYLTDDRGGSGLAFYVDASVSTPAFRDQGRRLSTDRNDPNVVRDLVAIAQHRGWTAISVRGQTGFRREVWLAARLEGLEVRGYRPTARDLQELERRAERRADRPPQTGEKRPRDRHRTEMGPATRLRMVEAVVRNRIVEPAAQARILAAARSRLADWIEASPKARSPSQRDR